MDTVAYLKELLIVYAFVWGALWGSFLNVVIYRLPRDMSLSRPPSHCPNCSTPIRWYDNVPIFGWLWLRGRCRDCKVPIPPRYPGVELLVALLSTLLWWQVSHDTVGVAPLQTVAMVFLFRFYFVLVLVAIAFIDLDLTIIPNRLTYPGMVWGLVAALLTPHTGPLSLVHPQVDIVSALVGLVAGGGVILAIYWGYRLATGRIGVGGGDVTMLALIGANLGWMSLPIVLLLASLQGLIAALGLFLWERVRRRGRDESLFLRGAHRDAFWTEEGRPEAPEDPEDVAEDDQFLRLALPFGPFLALAALQYLFFGEPMLRWLSGGWLP